MQTSGNRIYDAQPLKLSVHTEGLKTHFFFYYNFMVSDVGVLVLWSFRTGQSRYFSFSRNVRVLVHTKMFSKNVGISFLKKILKKFESLTKVSRSVSLV